MNETPENPAAIGTGAPKSSSATQPDLAAAIRTARLENAERTEAITDLREIEFGRLSLLQAELKPVVDQAPPAVDLFDLALTPGEHPRLFIDMIAFIDMAHDRRTYRFHHDTRYGRVLIAESPRIATIVAAVTNYVARRLVERERALAAEPPRADRAERPPAGRTHRAWSIANGPAREPRATLGNENEGPHAFARAPEPMDPPRRRFRKRLGDIFVGLLTTLGAITLALILGLGAYLGWTMRLRDLWADWVGGG
jgi:hypothetical protein